MLRIDHVGAEGEALESFKALIREHKQKVGVDFNPRGFEEEMVDPFARYRSPRGLIIVARWDGITCGCGAIQDLGDNVCELKRMYVQPEFRRKGIARAIAVYLLSHAEKVGYERVTLDTLRRLDFALALYKSIGFIEVESRVDSPTREVVMMEMVLSPKEPC